MSQEAQVERHPWFGSDGRRGPAGASDADFARWIVANQVLKCLQPLARIDPASPSAHAEAFYARKALMMEMPGGWESVFPCVEYILGSDSFNLTPQGKAGVRAALEMMIRLHPDFKECRAEFEALLARLDERRPGFAPQPGAEVSV